VSVLWSVISGINTAQSISVEPWVLGSGDRFGKCWSTFY